MGSLSRVVGKAVPAAVVAAVLIGAGPARGATTTWIQGRTISDTGGRYPNLALNLDVLSEKQTGTVGGGWYLVDGIVPGSYDRMKVVGGGLEDGIGGTFFTGAASVSVPDVLVVESSSVNRWADLLADGTVDGNGDLDSSLGVIFGEVRNAAGVPVAGATVSVLPAGGELYYFNEAGDPDPTATATPSTGRFLVLSYPPGDCVVTASASPGFGEAGILGRSYGRVIANTVSGLSAEPFLPVAGTAVDEAGFPVAGAVVSWSFDGTVNAVAGAEGGFLLNGVPRGLDLGLSGEAPGFRPALTFRRLRADTPDPLAMKLGFLSDAAYTAWQSAFGLFQAPMQGMIYGRVVGPDGTPVAGATVTPDPAVGTVRYFDLAGNPAPGLLQTSESGLFVIFNVPVGSVTLSAIAPRQAIRSVVVPSEAGAVTSGELLGMRLVSFEGRVLDELFQSSSVGGAVVTIVEYPFLSTIADAAGVFRFTESNGIPIPADEPITFQIARSGFKTSYSFMQTLRTSALCTRPSCSCPAETDSDYDPDCVAGKEFFVITETGYLNLYLQAKNTPTRPRGLVSAGVFFTNGEAAIGLQAALTPTSGTRRYSSDGNYGKNQITTIGAVQFLNAAPMVAGFALYDARNDQTSLTPIRVVADSLTLTDSQRVGCDPDSPGSRERNLYPCNGSQMMKAAKDAIFQWAKGSNIQGRVQVTADPTFEACTGSSGARCVKGNQRKNPFWHATSDIWKKIRKLGDPGAPVYWRVVLKDADGNETSTVPFVFLLP